MNWWSDKATDSADVEAQQTASDWASTPSTPAPTGNDTNGSSSTTPQSQSGWRRWCPFIPSIVLCILFLISFGLELNDSSLAALWAAFYALSAILCATIFVKPCCGNLVGIGFAGGMVVWALILIIVSAVDLSNTPKGGSREGGDSDITTKREEIAFELAGSCLAFCSALYHGCILFQSRRQNKN